MSQLFLFCVNPPTKPCFWFGVLNMNGKGWLDVTVGFCYLYDLVSGSTLRFVSWRFTKSAINIYIGPLPSTSWRRGWRRVLGNGSAGESYKKTTYSLRDLQTGEWGFFRIFRFVPQPEINRCWMVLDGCWATCPWNQWRLMNMVLPHIPYVQFQWTKWIYNLNHGGFQK